MRFTVQRRLPGHAMHALVRRNCRLSSWRAMLHLALRGPTGEARGPLRSFGHDQASDPLRPPRMDRVRQRRRLPRRFGSALRGPALSWRDHANLRSAAVGVVSAVAGAVEDQVGQPMPTIETAQKARPRSRCPPLWLWLSCALACGGGRTPMPAGISGNPEEAAWDGGLLSSGPGVVRCGSTVCAPGEKCCLRHEDRPASIGCVSLSETCGWGARSCDETADCDFGQLCCVMWLSSPPLTLGSRCHDSLTCYRGDYVACGSNDDCRAIAAPPCVAQRCRGDVLQTCGALPSGSCPP